MTAEAAALDLQQREAERLLATKYDPVAQQASESVPGACPPLCLAPTTHFGRKKPRHKYIGIPVTSCHSG